MSQNVRLEDGHPRATHIPQGSIQVVTSTVVEMKVYKREVGLPTVGFRGQVAVMGHHI